jgi:hypothetical protein
MLGGPGWRGAILKDAVFGRASLPAIGNLFMLWSILFLMWAIFFTEVFSLTRWWTHETWNMNFSVRSGPRLDREKPPIANGSIE